MNYESIIRERVQHLIDTYISYVLGNREENIVHDFRVCLRRNGVIFKALGDKKTAKKLKEYMRILGEIRDLEVQDSIFQYEFTEERDIRHIIAFEKERKTRKLEKQIWKWKIDKIEYHYDEVSFEEKLNLDIEKYEHKMKEGLEIYLNQPDFVHKARIRLKKYRYALELKSMADSTYDSELSLIKSMQEIMGHLQDYNVTREILKKFDIFEYEEYMDEREGQLHTKLRGIVTIFLQQQQMID